MSQTPRKGRPPKVKVSSMVTESGSVEVSPAEDGEPEVSAALAIEDEADPLEPLTLDDLLSDGNKIRAVESLFPATIDGTKDQRIYVVEVPGEELYAVVWYTNTQWGPELVKLDRLSQWYRGGFTVLGGETYTYERSASCGCGNQLRNYRPWSGYVRIVQVAPRY